jgi:serine/threonine protein kinase
MTGGKEERISTPSEDSSNDVPERTSSVGMGRYRLIAQMAACAWGPLWVARGSGGAHDGRIVLLRRVARKPPVDAPLLRKLAASAFAAVAVRDARVAAVLDVVITEEEVAVATEYVEGELLRSLQRRAGLGNRPLDVPVALRLALDISCAAIAARDGLRAAATDASVRAAVHSGISPDSILVASFGDSVLLDVGVTGPLLSREEFVAHPEVAAYRAPEQFARGVVDERANVFSLGVLLWELLTNRPLFGSPRWARFVAQGEPPPATVEEGARTRHRVLEMPIPRLDAVVRAGSAIPRDVADIVDMALERNPKERHPSLEALRDALTGLGESRLATLDDMAASVAAIASTSLEARRAALSTVGGPPSLLPASMGMSLRSTMPPPADPGTDTVKLEELAWSPDALRSLETNAPKPPPLPKRRAP